MTLLCLKENPCKKISFKKQLNAYKHKGFWQCMDTMRDKTLIEDMLKRKQAPWI